MSTSFATSPNSGLSGPSTPSRRPLDPSVQFTDSSPVGKVYQYHIPEDREEYQEFGYEDDLLLRPFSGAEEFFEFLQAELPDPLPTISPGSMDTFFQWANMVSSAVRRRYFQGRPILKFENTGSKTPDGHVTDTKCKPDITAAFEDVWDNNPNNVIPWPFIQLAGEVASSNKTKKDQKKQAISYLHYLLLARPDRYVAQGLLSSLDMITFIFGIGGEGIREFNVKWNDPDLNKVLYAFIYRLYEPGDRFVDSSYAEVKQIKLDNVTTATYTIKLSFPGGTTQKCPGFYPIYARHPFGTRTHVLSNPHFKGNDFTVIKEQFCRVQRRFEEQTILYDHVHKPEGVPGVVAAAYREKIMPPLSQKRCKYRLGPSESGSPFMSIPTLSNMLETLFDVLEVLRYLRLHCKVLHRDVSAGNVLYIENSSDRSLPPDPVTDGSLCYAKYLLGKSRNPLETSMLLVDFNLAEHLEPENSVKKQRTEQMGTPIFIARAVQRGRPVPLVDGRVPGIPKSPPCYTLAHPERAEKFPSSRAAYVDLDREESRDSYKFMIGNQSIDISDQFHGRWRHELGHDAESVFWLLLYWAMGAQPENMPKEKIDAGSWANLIGNDEARIGLITTLPKAMTSNIVHSFYEPLRRLIEDLSAILVIDNHWLPASDLRKDEYYITEAFQRLILSFMLENRNKAFMNHRIEKTFRKRHGVQKSGGTIVTTFQSLHAAS